MLLKVPTEVAEGTYSGVAEGSYRGLPKVPTAVLVKVHVFWDYCFASSGPTF